MMAFDNNKLVRNIGPRPVNQVLESLARLLSEDRDAIIAANRADIEACPDDDAVIMDRLKVDNEKVDRMIDSVRRVIEHEDPLGKVIFSHTRRDGLRVENRRVPFGTILIIFEARPDVCIEAAIIAVKAGNRILLKGGKEARNTNLLLTGLWKKALEQNEVDPDSVRYLDITREQTQKLISGGTDKFDLVIPRGGEALIDFAVKNSKAPVLVSGRGNNFLFVDEEADPEMALRIAIDGKSRLSVCNALDKILVHSNLPDVRSVIGKLAVGFQAIGVEVFGDEQSCAAEPTIRAIDDDDIWFEEFLSAKIVIGVANSIEDAIARINKYSGGHSATIVTGNSDAAERFMNDVDCAAVYHNASTRFTDGGEFGLGAEIAISTQKLHFRGPLGVEHLLTNKWFVYGEGHVRG